MKTFYFTRRHMSKPFAVKARTVKAAYNLLEKNGCKRIDYTRCNESGTPVHLW